jgi:hypothetical protein
MSYFDFLTSGYFKTEPDGRKLFFPWGVLGRGYAIASEQDFQRLQRQIKIYMVVSLVLVLGSASLEGDLFGLAVATLLIGFYAVWSQYLLRGLQRSDERLSLQEAMASRGAYLARWSFGWGKSARSRLWEPVSSSSSSTLATG